VVPRSSPAGSSVPGGRGQQRLPPSGSSGHAGGQVDRCPEPVAPALDRGAGVHAHPHQREAVPGAHVVHDAQPEPDRRRGVAGPRQRIADGLDLMGVMGGQELAHGHTEPVDKVDGLLVPMGLGEGGEA
jgi:hypothetical protein